MDGEKILNLLEYGFPTFFSVIIIYLIYKGSTHIPTILQAWAKFIEALNKNTWATEKSVDVIEKNVAQTRSILDELKDVKRKLDSHENCAESLKVNQKEILTLLNEINMKVEVLSNESH